MSRLTSSRYSGFSSKIGTIPPNLGRLDTLQGFLGGPGGMIFRKKYKFEVFKLLEMH